MHCLPDHVLDQAAQACATKAMDQMMQGYASVPEFQHYMTGLYATAIDFLWKGANAGSNTGTTAEAIDFLTDHLQEFNAIFQAPPPKDIMCKDDKSGYEYPCK